MSKSIPAVYERGVFRPLHPVELQDGQSVALSVEPLSTAPTQADNQLSKWAQVYDGLVERDIAEIERIALDRTHFLHPRAEES